MTQGWDINHMIATAILTFDTFPSWTPLFPNLFVVSDNAKLFSFWTRTPTESLYRGQITMKVAVIFAYEKAASDLVIKYILKNKQSKHRESNISVLFLKSQIMFFMNDTYCTI